MGVWQTKQRKRVGTGISSPVNVARKHNRLQALTASGQKVTRTQAESIRRVQQPAAARSFSYYDSIGEIKYASQFYARMLAPLELYAAEINDDGEIVPTENDVAKAALDRIQDPGGGRTGLMSSYGRLMFLTGEAQLFVSLDEDTGAEQWEMLSSDELRYQGGGYQRFRAPSLGSEEYRSSADMEGDESWVPVDDDTAVAYRLWQRHPRYSALADCTMFGVLDLCEELLLLTQAVRSRARSRIAGAGILFIDASISPPPDEPAPDEDPEEDPFIADLTETMTEPIADEGSAAAVVPMVVRVETPDGAKLVDMVHHLQLVDPTQLYPETGLRYEIIKRIALGLDMPPEELIGMADANHWTAWQIDEDTWKAHGQPKAQQFCDDLTSAYFRPYLTDKVDDASRFVIAYDASKIINHPDRAKDAKDLYDRVVIGKEALRDATGFDEDDAPSEAERAEMIGIKVRDASLAWYGEPSVKSGGVEPEPGVIVDADHPASTADQGASTGAEVEAGPPPAAETGGNTNLAASAAMAARVMGAADLAVLRAREKAGAQLRSFARRDPDITLNGTRNSQIAWKLGREGTKKVGAPSAVELVSGSRDLLIDSLRMWGVTDQSVVSLIVAQVERHAARTLYDEHPRGMPSTFANYIAGLLSGA